jgi:hypothetical protein
MAKASVNEFLRLRADRLGPPKGRSGGEFSGGQGRSSLRCDSPQLGPVEVAYQRRGGLVVLEPAEAAELLALPVEVGPRGRTRFVCLGCARRVRDLYLRFGFFLCRHCHDLSYPSQGRHYPPRARPGMGAATADPAQELAAAFLDTDLVLLGSPGKAAPGPAETVRGRSRQGSLGRPGRPRERRRYHVDGSRRVSLGLHEAYCCKCRASRPYRYPRHVQLHPRAKPGRGALQTRTAIRARCRVCNTRVFRIVSTVPAVQSKG